MSQNWKRSRKWRRRSLKRYVTIPSVLHHLDLILQIGHPTILVNNAGVAQGKLILDLSPEDIRQSVPLLFIAI
jgi:NAD(P)-dependent dehydrogenase (short-subunit alcohol dehydrogenase family)